MASLNIIIHDDIDKEVRGRYSDWKTRDLLKRYVERDGDLSEKQVVEMLKEMLPPPEEEHRRYQTGYLVEAILWVAFQTPYSHPAHKRLANLMYELIVHQRIGVTLEDCLGPMFMFLNDRFPWESYDENNTVNMNAFVARLAAGGLVKDPRSKVMWIMTHYLKGRTKLPDGLSSEDINEINDHVNVAAVWILCAGQCVFDAMVLYPSPVRPSLDRAYGPHTGPIYGMQQWKRWQKAFEIEAERDSADDVCRKNALKAAKLMDAIAQCCEW